MNFSALHPADGDRPRYTSGVLGFKCFRTLAKSMATCLDTDVSRQLRMEQGSKLANHARGLLMGAAQ